MVRASAPDQRRGNANKGSLSDKPEVIKPTNVLPVSVPPAPDSFAQFEGAQFAMANELWLDIWTAGGDFYQPATDRFVIERYVALQVRRQKLIHQLEREGYTGVGSQGQMVAHPAARLVLDIEAKLPVLEDRLGLNPDARLRLGLAVAETKSRLDKFREDEDAV